MEITILQAPSNKPTAPNASSIQFGNELLVYSESSLKSTIAQSQIRRADVSKEQLHIVVQNGQLFQQHLPDVPVIHDRGRFLLVKLDPREVKKLNEEGRTCYRILPVPESQVVFEEFTVPSARRAPVPFVRVLVGGLNRNRLETNLEMLTAFTTRLSTSVEYTSASLQAQQMLDAMNYRTRFQAVMVPRGSSRNVIADKVGEGDDRRVIVVTAHLDSVNWRGGPAAPAPGADDNGSGSAGLLEMAHVFQNHRGKNDLRFILFGGEEQGFFGSEQYVAGLSSSERNKIKAVINMDMIGCVNRPPQTVLLEGAPISQGVINSLKHSAATYTQLAVKTALNPSSSDHVSFINGGIPAVLTIEGADKTNHRVHTDRDTIDTINYDFAMEILAMNTAYVAEEIGDFP